MALEGKGFFIWRILNCEGGNSEVAFRCGDGIT